MTATTPRHLPVYRALAAALACLPAFGCQPAMSTPSPDSASHVVRNVFPLRFKEHNFEANCYNTIGCSVVYAGTHELETGEDEVSPGPKTADYRNHWGGAMHVAISNFPPPAVVEWKSMDGISHQAHVDVGEIFKDQLILHNVPQEEIPVETAATVGGPDVFLEVNDRTINVYMKAAIALRDTALRHSDFREDLILAWSHTY